MRPGMVWPPANSKPAAPASTTETTFQTCLSEAARSRPSGVTCCPHLLLDPGAEPHVGRDNVLWEGNSRRQQTADRRSDRRSLTARPCANGKTFGPPAAASSRREQSLPPAADVVAHLVRGRRVPAAPDDGADLAPIQPDVAQHAII